MSVFSHYQRCVHNEPTADVSAATTRLPLVVNDVDDSVQYANPRETAPGSWCQLFAVPQKYPDYCDCSNFTKVNIPLTMWSYQECWISCRCHTRYRGLYYYSNTHTQTFFWHVSRASNTDQRMKKTVPPIRIKKLRLFTDCLSFLLYYVFIKKNVFII